MSRKFWNWVRNDNDERILMLNGEISNETWFGDEITPKEFRGELNSGQGKVTVWINSPGGDCFAAAQIYNMLMEYPGTVDVHIDGIAASAASVIAMAGNHVAISPVGMMMIHNPADDEDDEPEGMIFSRAAVTNSLLNKLKAQVPKPDNRVDASVLNKRLDLIGGM